MSEMFDHIKDRIMGVISTVKNSSSNNQILPVIDNSCADKMPTSLRLNHWSAAVMAFFVPAIMFFIFRIHLFPLFNSDATFAFGSQNINLLEAFSSKYNYANFRPLSIFLEQNIGYLYRAYDERFHIIVVSIVAILHGLLSLLIYRICFNYSKSILTSFLALFFYIFSTASIDATWHNMFSAFMLGPLLTACGAIFAYQRFRGIESWGRWVYLGVFTGLCLAGPWFREFGYVPAAVVLVVELWQLPKRRSFFFLIPAVLLAHALIPKALASACGLYDGPVRFVFIEGNINTNIFSPSIDSINQSGFCNFISAIANRNTAGFIINELPLLLWICVLPAMAYGAIRIFPCLFRKEYWSVCFKPHRIIELEKTNPESGRTSMVQWGAGIAVLCLLVFLFRPLFEGNSGTTDEKLRLLWFLISFAFLSALRFGILFPAWFIVTVPSLMLLGSNHEIHTAFAVLPMAVICALYFRDLIQFLGRPRLLLLRKILITFVVLVSVFIVFDHAGNVGTSFLAVQNLNTGHQRIGRWISDNVPDGSLVFTDFFAARDIMYRSSFSGSKYIFQPIRYEWIGGHMNTPQIDIIRKAVEQRRKVFYIHLKTYSTDLYLPLPIDSIRKRATFEIDNMIFAVDPLRLAVDRRQYLRRFIPSEWDNTYGWVGYGANRFIWRAEIEVYELIETDVAKLDESSFKDPRRYLFPPREAGGDSVTEWTAPHTAWTNNIDTDAVPYEKFKSSGPKNIIQAVNTTGFGIANTPSFSIAAGKQYEVTFDMVKKSGIYPTFRISEDPYGNTSMLNEKTADGRMEYTFKIPQSRTCYAVFRVEDGEETDFSVSSFSLKEAACKE